MIKDNLSMGAAKPHPEGPGRPATGGRDPMMSIRLPRELIDRVDEWAKLNDISRSEAVRRLIEHSLPQEARRLSRGAGK